MAAEMSDDEFEAFRKDSRKFIPLPLFDLIMGGKEGNLRNTPNLRGPEAPAEDRPTRPFQQ